MGFLSKAVSSIIITIGSEIIIKRVAPTVIKKSKKFLKDLEKKQNKKEAEPSVE